MLVEGDAVETHTLQFNPSIEMLLVGADRDLGLEVLLHHRVGETPVDP